MKTIEEKLAYVDYWLTKYPKSKKLNRRRAKYLLRESSAYKPQLFPESGLMGSLSGPPTASRITATVEL